MCGNTLKLNWDGFCLKEKYINIHIVYEQTYFSIFIMTFFVADAYDSRPYLEYVLRFYE